MDARLSDFRILIVPGLHGSGPDHWQSRWEALYPRFERVEQRDWSRPDLETWSAQVGHLLRRSSRPAVIVAHSFGCLAAVNRAGQGARNLAGLLLVAPANPEKFTLVPQLEGLRLDVPATLIGSTNDPWMSASHAEEWAGRWRADFVNAGALGHINADSALGDWLPGLAHLQRLLQRIPVRPACRCGAARTG